METATSAGGAPPVRQSADTFKTRQQTAESEMKNYANVISI